MPEFLATYPGISVDLHLSDAMVDVIGEGFDAALRIANMPDSSLVVRRLCGVEARLLAAPAYLKAHGRPKHPLHLAEHACVSYAYMVTPDTWRFTNKSGEVASVRPEGPLRVNNGDAMLPALIAGLGFALNFFEIFFGGCKFLQGQPLATGGSKPCSPIGHCHRLRFTG